MIRTTTYLDDADLQKDVLAAFSAVDRSNTDEMSDEAISKEFRRLLSRLAAIVSLHGNDVPHNLVEQLAASTPSEAFELVNGFLEGGHATGDESGLRELQQEIVHFSRIVDLDFAADSATRRLNHASRLSIGLKVLIELITVGRSRMLQRGVEVDVPPRGRSNASNTDIGPNVTIQRADGQTDYVLTIAGVRRRERRNVAFQYGELLAYLTPTEAFWAMASHYVEADKRPEVSAVLTVATGTGVNQLSWEPMAASDTDNDFQFVASSLPKPVEASASVAFDGVTEATTALDCSTCGPATLTISVSQNEPVALPLINLNGKDAAGIPIEDFVQRGLSAIQGLSNLPTAIASIEFGHIHLDRDLDIDQEVGTAMGSAVSKWVAQNQDVAPVNALMIDDDHVLIRLLPSNYVKFVKSYLGEDEPFILIPESSPVIRAVVVALYHRLMQSPIANNVMMRGANRYVTLSDDSVVELFEDYDGACVTGCVFFEAALLLYRAHHDRFIRAFMEITGATENPNQTILSILDSDQSHDDKQLAVSTLAMSFGDILDPHQPGGEFSRVVNEILDSMTSPVVHLNVLEDYYGVQQNKVRRFFADLGLPFDLRTLHFNARTGSVFIAQ